MAKPGKDISGWKILAVKLLHPFPVFIIVTALSALVYAVPNLRQTYQSSTTSVFGIMTLALNIILPLATGLIAALGVYFGLSDLRRKADDRGDSGSTEGAYSSDDRSKAIARHLPTAAITFDVNDKITFINPAAADLFDIHKPEDHDAIDQFIDSNNLRLSIEEVLKGGTVKVEKTGTLADSPLTGWAWRITGIPITRQEEVVEALLLIEDRTQYRLLEDELIRSEDRYRNIFNHAPCGIFFADSHGNYLDANPAALEMLGYSLDELTTLSTRELSADSDRRLRRLRETPGWIEEETRYLRKDGKVVEAQLLASSYQSGSDTYFIGIAKDVTARNELERSLSAAKARLKAVLSLESRPLILLDNRNHITNLNSAAVDLLDCPSEKLMGMPLDDLIDGDPPPLQETSSASSSPCIFNIPDGPPKNLSVIRLPLGTSTNPGSLLLLSGGPLPVISNKS
jgi:PAS domain S-box-containing protein